MSEKHNPKKEYCDAERLVQRNIADEGTISQKEAA
jgi:hypothetical protein